MFKTQKNEPTEYRVYFKLAGSKGKFELDPRHFIERRFGFLSRWFYRRANQKQDRLQFTDWLINFLASHGIDVTAENIEFSLPFRYGPDCHMRPCVVHLNNNDALPSNLCAERPLTSRGMDLQRAAQLDLA